MVHMRRRQIQFTEDQELALQARADATGQPFTAVVREVVDTWRAGDERHAIVERAQAAIGGFRSGLRDVSENHDEYIVQAIEERIGRR
jgi:hypothetical protein